MAASEIYRAEMTGVDPDPQASIVHPSISGSEEQMEAELRRAEVQAAELTVSARVAARLASLSDQAERGGVAGFFAKVELVGSRVLQATEFKQSMKEGGLVDALRLAART